MRPILNHIQINLIVAITSLATTPVSAVPLPMECVLTSEEVPSIQVRLTERTVTSLKGKLIQDGKSLGIFQTGQSNGFGTVWWSFEDQYSQQDGSSILFKDDRLWNRYRSEPASTQTNRVLFVGLASDLYYTRTDKDVPFPFLYRDNFDLLMAAEGFWSISGKCLGGRIVRG